MHVLIRVLAVLGVLFAAGVTTSYAEYKFQYSLYETVAAKLFGRKF